MGPTPSPPSPPSPPSQYHYEQPPCQDDEIPASISDTDGSCCAPMCQDGACPSDLPPDTSATPSCLLNDDSGNEYCALQCTDDWACPANAQCWKQDQDDDYGICLYPNNGNLAITKPRVL